MKEELEKLDDNAEYVRALQEHNAEYARALLEVEEESEAMQAESEKQIAALNDQLTEHDEEIVLVKRQNEAAMEEAATMASVERSQVSQMVSQMMEESKQQLAEVCEESRVAKERLEEEIEQLKASHSSATSLLESTHRAEHLSLTNEFKQLQIHLFAMNSNHEAEKLELERRLEYAAQGEPSHSFEKFLKLNAEMVDMRNSLAEQQSKHAKEKEHLEDQIEMLQGQVYAHVYSKGWDAS